MVLVLLPQLLSLACRHQPGQAPHPPQAPNALLRSKMPNELTAALLLSLPSSPSSQHLQCQLRLNLLIQITITSLLLHLRLYPCSKHHSHKPAACRADFKTACKQALMQTPPAKLHHGSKPQQPAPPQNRCNYPSGSLPPPRLQGLHTLPCPQLTQLLTCPCQEPPCQQQA